MKIRNKLNDHSFSSITIRTIDASTNSAKGVDCVDITVKLEVGGDIIGEFKGDGISLWIDMINTSKLVEETHVERLYITMSPSDAYALYKSVGFYLDECESVKQKDV